MGLDGGWAPSIDRVQLQPRGTGADASWSYVNSVILRPGRYAVRLAAASADGRLGSVEYTLDARLRPGEGAALSDVLILDPMRPAGKGLATVVDGRVIGPGLEVYLETYPLRGRAVSAVAFDIADRPDGPPVAGVRAKPVSAEEGRRLVGLGGHRCPAASARRLRRRGDRLRGRHEAGAGQPALQARRSPIGPSRREGRGRRSAWPSRADSSAHSARRMP